jgi:flagellar protein FlaJ
MERRIPFVPFPLPLAKQIVKPFYGIGGRLEKLYPGLGVRLTQAGIDANPREYLAVAFFCLWFWAMLIFVVFLVFSLLFPSIQNLIYVMTTVPMIVGFLAFVYITLYPSLIVSRKIRELDKNLLFSLRHLLIQVRSGVSLFDSLVSVSEKEYGLVSKEFKECVKKISTGMSQTEALEELILRNPSLHFRRVIWQLTNAIRTGADLGDTLEAIVDNLSGEQKVAIRRYGSQLNPLSMMYMMTAVILPSLGITFLILLSSLSGIIVSEFMFWAILAALIVFQFMFIGIVKNRRPAIEL